MAEQKECRGIRITKNKFCVDYYENFLTKEYADKLFLRLKSEYTGKEKRRTAILFGKSNLIYSVDYSGTGERSNIRVARDWTKIPELIEIRDRLNESVGQDHNVVAVQLYPTYQGIKPHRDKELPKGTHICGVSLGVTRRMIFEPGYYVKPKEGESSTPANEPGYIDLKHGSLYVMRSPTNEYWTHSIEEDHDITGPRISLTYRKVPEIYAE